MTCPGNRIRYLRKLHGMSQEELGRRVGVQRAAVNKYETGGVTNIPLTTIEKIARVFDVSPSYIVGWDDSATNPLAVEVKLLQGIQHFYGSEVVQIIEEYQSLDSVGKRRVRQYVDDMSMVYHVDEVELI